MTGIVRAELPRPTTTPPASMSRISRVARIPAAVVSEQRIHRRRIVSALLADGLTVWWQGDSLDTVDRGEPAPAEGVTVVASDISKAETVAALRRFRKRAPRAHVVIVSPSPQGAGVRRALNAGAEGFVLESHLASMLAPTVRAVHAGQVCAPRELRRWVAKPQFSHREKEILELVALGLTNKAIARRLFLTESTVKSHLTSLFDKLGVRSRKEAAALLLDPEEGLQTIAFPAETVPVVLSHEA
jgi:DNA-binding NarL/FixJ family response regulator